MKTSFQHVYLPGTSGRTLLLLHGTGGSENDLVPLGRTLDPEAAILSPLGKVRENGMPRFFRRLAEGVFDEEDLVNRTHELADFVEEAIAERGIDRSKLIAVGYSNGANIAASMLLLRPEILAGAALLRAMVPLVPEVLPDLAGTPVLLSSGHLDPIVPAENTRQLAALLRNAGADVALRLENAGHGLTSLTVETAKSWLETAARSERHSPPA
jgi:phospholipase/carboxylesterase